MWLTIDYVANLASEHGVPRSDLVAAIRAGELPLDNLDPHGPPMIRRLDYEEWKSRRSES